MGEVECLHVEGQQTFGDLVVQWVDEGKVDAHTAICFDFDRTLTNGLSTGTGQEAVRGGADLISALEKALAVHAKFFIATARSPRKLIIEGLRSSLAGPQHLLQPFFASGDGAQEDIEIFDFHGSRLAKGGPLYACGDQKSMALLHILESSHGEISKIIFVDDAVINCYDVYQKMTKAAANCTVVWWDPYQEEMEARSMIPELTSSSDFNYAPFLKSQLENFGVNDATRSKRYAQYSEREKAEGREDLNARVITNPKRLSGVDKFKNQLSALFKPPASSK